MLRADIAKRGGLAFFRMMETETAFLHHPAGFRIAVIIPAPDGGHSQILKTPSQQAAHGLWYKTLSPERPAYPVAYFSLACLHLSVQTFSVHDSCAPDRLACLFQDHSIGLRSGKHSPKDSASDSCQGRNISRSVTISLSIVKTLISLRFFCSLFPSRSFGPSSVQIDIVFVQNTEYRTHAAESAYIGNVVHRITGIVHIHDGSFPFSPG